MSVFSVRSENIVDKQWEIVEKELQDHVEALQRRSDQLLLRNLNRLKDLEQLSSRNSRKKKSKFEDLQRFDATQEKKQELIEQRKEFEKKYKNVFEGFCNEISKLVTSHQIVVEREFRKFEASLPIYSKRSTILEAVHSTQVVVLVGETGSEKSTQLAQYLAEEDSKEGIIFVTEPDKSTALGLAKQVSNEFLCKLGDEICVNSRVNDKTKIKFATHKDLLNEVIKGDEIIQQCSVIIIDQAQERSVDVDMLLAVLKQSLQCFSHLKLIIVSTQQNSCVFQDYFPGSTKITVPGKVYPVKTVYAEKRLPRYVDAVCDKVVEVCQSRGGDILVFLAQPHEIEKTCEKLKETLDDAKYIILPLYGKLELDQKSKVFETTPEGKRKIVVATNIAESWMVVPGIKIVIDSGMKMEASFYPLNNMTTLEAQLVNQNSAKQRASRAGLTGPGKCYCLFTKYDYNKMEKSSTPGISNVNLEFPVLQLLSFGVKNVESFDFVENPPPESLEMALKNLESLGAIDDCGILTDIGNEILQLPTEPRLSKALLEGLERGCGDDAVIAAALIYRGHNVFFRGTVHGKEDSAFQKQFCFSGGDLVSAVNVYKKWMALTPKKKILFCKQNALDTKLLRSVNECFKEIKNALLVKRPNLQFEVTTDDVRKSLCKSLLAGYPENIALLCDNKDGDYITYVSKVNVKIHPSSVLSLLGDEPKYVMYQKLHRNGKTVFMENVTPIEFDWLSEVSGYVDMPFASKSPVNRQRTKHANDTIGCKKSRAKSVKEPVSNGKRVDTTHAEIRNAYPGHVYGVSGNDVNYVKRNQFLDHFEVSVFNVGGIKLLLSNALRTESILQPEACCKFDVFLRKVDLNAGVDAQKLIATLKNYGKVLNTCCYHRPSNDNTFYHWGTVTYCSSKEAKKASVFIQPLKDYIGSEDFAGQNVKGLCLEPTHAECFPSHSYSASSVRSTVIVSWFPLPAQRFAFVKCENEDILQKILKSLVQNMRPPLSGSSGASKRTDVGDICLPIIENANKRTVREILKKCCGPTLLEGVTKIRIPPKPLCHFNVEKEKKKLTKLLMNYSSAKLQSIRTINNKKVEAFVVFVNMDSAQTFVSEVNRTSDFLARLYEIAPAAKRNTFELMKPEVIIIDDPVTARYFFSGLGRKRLAFIEKKNKVSIYSCDYGRRVQITGFPTSQLRTCTEMIMKLIEEFDSNRETDVVEVDLSISKRPVGTIRKILKQFGNDFFKLVEDENCVASLDIQRRKLVFSGSKLSILNVQRKLAKYFDSMSNNSKNFSIPETCCPICLANVETSFSLTHCKHNYCLICIKCYIYDVLSSGRTKNKFPLQCLKENCTSSVVKDDYIAILKTEDIGKLCKVSLECFLIDNPNFKSCPTIDCSWIYEVSESPSVFLCPACNFRLCRKCGDSAHEMFSTCEEYEASKD